MLQVLQQALREDNQIREPSTRDPSVTLSVPNSYNSRGQSSLAGGRLNLFRKSSANALFDPTNVVVILTGNLLKRGSGMLDGWQERKFVLTRGREDNIARLSYYGSKGERKGSFVISQQVDVQWFEENDRNYAEGKHRFKILNSPSCPDRVYELEATSLEDMKNWVGKLREQAKEGEAARLAMEEATKSTKLDAEENKNDSGAAKPMAPLPKLDKLLVGNLLKRGQGRLDGWSERKFVLTRRRDDATSRLTYYTSNGQMKGSFIIDRATIETLIQDDRHYRAGRHRFQILHSPSDPDRVYVLEAATAADLKRWVSKLKEQAKGGEKARAAAMETEAKEEGGGGDDPEKTSPWSKFLIQNGLAKEEIVFSGLIEKGSFSGFGFGGKKRRLLLLTSFPRLIYADPQEKKFKGEIPWSEDIVAQKKDNKNFLIKSAGKTYLMTALTHEAEEWVSAINKTKAGYKNADARLRAHNSRQAVL
mmetsp:Transcript_23589/g.44064  ORF Transcript_23589/g.44064 Transcript_23589/m.44064 type:complete len:477 (-) Transcript_23589:269-1699(-)